MFFCQLNYNLGTLLSQISRCNVTEEPCIKLKKLALNLCQLSILNLLRHFIPILTPVGLSLFLMAVKSVSQRLRH
nr:MAG TPA: hypothetical protein [Bacteriophage sp.]